MFLLEQNLIFHLCFLHATEKLELSHTERCLLLPLYNRFVMDRFGQVLALSNQSLAEQDFNPESKYADRPV